MATDGSVLGSDDAQQLGRTDEDDFKQLRSKNLDDIFDPDFRDFAKWMRKTYTSKYPYSKMRSINREAVFELLKAFGISIAVYSVLRIYFFDYVLFWFAPFWVFQLLWVIQKEEICHLRSHWIVNMTGSSILDMFVDCSMIFLAGASKELIRRRHIAAHYSDIANLARLYSDVWIPFTTLPPVFYLRLDIPIRLLFNTQYCEQEKLNRKQLLIETIGLWFYGACLVSELYFLRSFYMLAFHMVPMMVFMSATVCSATICHSGVDRRNSFDSNGLFDADTAEGLFACHLRLLCWVGDSGVHNHGIHHAFTQLPLSILNKEYKEINAYALKTYKHVRMNTTISHIIHANVLAKCPPPKWYDYIIQYICSAGIVLVCTGTFLGLPVLPIGFELMAVDYRAWFIYSSKAQHYANFAGMLRCFKIPERKEKGLKDGNDYLKMIIKHYDMMVDYCAQHNTPIPEFSMTVNPEVAEFNGLAQFKDLKKVN